MWRSTSRQCDWRRGERLETVDLDRSPIHAVLNEERRDLCTLITLELDNLAHLLVVDKSAVAGELLLECFQDLLLVILWTARQYS